MIETLSETVILPIAGVILAIVMTLELIRIITDRNNFHEIETAVFFMWMFKSGSEGSSTQSMKQSRSSARWRQRCGRSGKKFNF